MESILGRYKNLIVLAAVLFAQVLGLALQVKRQSEEGSTRLLRLWAVTAVTPLEKLMVGTKDWTRHLWRDYIDLRNVRRENQDLRDQMTQLRLDQIRLADDAAQGQRLQALLGFKEQFISKTVAAEVISTTGSEFSRGLYINKGSQDGLKPDMAVITPSGVVGKVLKVFPSSSLILLLNDASSGAGVILQTSRLQGVLKGTASGETVVHNIMKDEDVKVGERVLTSGGDGVYPKGLQVGTVTGLGPGPDIFMTVKVKPLASLNRLEEVLVITKVEEKPVDVAGTPAPRQRAADVLAERLPSIPVKAPDDSAKSAGSVAPGGTAAPAGTVSSPGTARPGAVPAKPAPTGPAGSPAAAASAPTGKKPVPATPPASPRQAEQKPVTPNPKDVPN